MHRPALTLALVAACLPAAPAQQEPPGDDDARRAADKLAGIVDYAAREETAGQRVVLSEREVNAYLRARAAEFPSGVVDPHVALAGGGRVSVRATVDLDAVTGGRRRGVLDPLRYLLRGSLPVSARGVLTAADGRGAFEVESTTVAGAPVPASVFYDLARFYLRSETSPEGVDLAEPFELPYRIRAISIEVGEAVIVQ